jgi:hypothetical protein
MANAQPGCKPRWCCNLSGGCGGQDGATPVVAVATTIPHFKPRRRCNSCGGCDTLAWALAVTVVIATDALHCKPRRSCNSGGGAGSAQAWAPTIAAVLAFSAYVLLFVLFLAGRVDRDVLAATAATCVAAATTVRMWYDNWLNERKRRDDVDIRQLDRVKDAVRLTSADDKARRYAAEYVLDGIRKGGPPGLGSQNPQPSAPADTPGAAFCAAMQRVAYELSLLSAPFYRDKARETIAVLQDFMPALAALVRDGGYHLITSVGATTHTVRVDAALRALLEFWKAEASSAQCDATHAAAAAPKPGPQLRSRCPHCPRTFSSPCCSSSAASTEMSSPPQRRPVWLLQPRYACGTTTGSTSAGGAMTARSTSASSATTLILLAGNSDSTA